MYISEINSLSVVSFAVIFSHPEDCLFTLFVVSFAVQKLLRLISSKFFMLFFFHYIRRWVREDLGEGNGTPLQYSCLENPMDRGAWKAAVHGVAEGRT